MSAVEAGSGRIDASETVLYKAVKGGSLTPFQENDVLFAKVTPCMENGKVAMAAGLRGGRAVGSTELFALRSLGAVEPKYLMYYLLQPSIRRVAARAMTGAVGLRRVPRTYLASLEIPVPPLAEQQRIIGALEGHLARNEAGLNAVHRLLKLGKSWTSSLLLNSTRNHPEVSKWAVLPIAEMAVVSTGATPRTTRIDYYKGGTIPWVTSAQLTRPYIDEADKMITELALEETSAKLLPPGTLLVAMYGEGRTRGHCSELLISAATNQACAAIQMKSEYDFRRPWVKLVLEASYEANRSLAAGGVQPNLSLGLIRNINIPLPPKDLQDEILENVNTLRGASTRLNRTAELLKERGSELHEQLLRSAFAGRLVPQDPEDEPASVLLKQGRSMTSMGKRTTRAIEQTAVRRNMGL
jgi:type I restriction enzyme S subunit